MSEIILSSSSTSVDKAINEYHDLSSFSGSSDSSSNGSNSSSGGKYHRQVHIWGPWGSIRGSSGRT